MRVRRTLRFIYKMLELAANGPAKYDIILMPAAHTHTHTHTQPRWVAALAAACQPRCLHSRSDSGSRGTAT
jgi:hypothetical protein